MNDQEKFWKGAFGDEYVERNNSETMVAAKIDMFCKALRAAGRIDSIVELGASRGLNAVALKALYPDSDYTGVEINDRSFRLLEQNPSVDSCHHSSIHDYDTEGQYDLALVAGVLIHLNPQSLPCVYRLLAKLSSRYVLMSEYYSPSPVEISYRGHSGKLFKRDFAKELMDETGFRLVDYGFVYRNDPKFGHDDITWFLLER